MGLSLLGILRAGASFSAPALVCASVTPGVRVGFTQGKLHETQRWLLLRRAIQERDGNAEPAAVLDARGAQHTKASPKRMREIGQQHWEHPGPAQIVAFLTHPMVVSTKISVATEKPLSWVWSFPRSSSKGAPSDGTISQNWRAHPKTGHGGVDAVKVTVPRRAPASALLGQSKWGTKCPSTAGTERHGTRGCGLEGTKTPGAGRRTPPRLGRSLCSCHSVSRGGDELQSSPRRCFWKPPAPRAGRGGAGIAELLLLGSKLNACTSSGTSSPKPERFVPM
ncbi:hypothetical protein Anapl_10728 [Anas platyrhynchos]|uniref:Secreted protein n=1 Tax=Anas platyrhynchos TaxID=8839 RepID=R0JRE6_ANAPL|nr:hypothetical protein Anapl_10728 [Anas platyrhynchos]